MMIKKFLFTWSFVVLSVMVGACIGFIGNSIIEYFKVDSQTIFGFAYFAINVITALMGMISVLNLHDHIINQRGKV